VTIGDLYVRQGQLPGEGKVLSAGKSYATQVNCYGGKPLVLEILFIVRRERNRIKNKGGSVWVRN
jgi:hypothetical protein